MLELNLASSDNRQRFRDALASAFFTYDQLAALHYLYLSPMTGVPTLESVAADRLGLAEVLVRVVMHAESRGYALELLIAALLENPYNRQLNDFASQAPLVWRKGARPAEQQQVLLYLLKQAHEKRLAIEHLTGLTLALDATALPPGTGFERLLSPRMGFQDPADWRKKLAERERQVCQIVMGDGVAGTGFLVGPDLVLTNSHVVFDSRWDQPLLRFPAGYAVKFDGAEEGRVALSDGALVERSPADNLDYALLRLATPVGNERGWFDVQAGRGDPQPGEVVFVLQHPGGGDLKLAAGIVRGDVPTPSDRLAYTANTRPGSSGSPCLDIEWRPVALHHFGDTDHNRGVRLAAIAEEIKTHLTPA